MSEGIVVGRYTEIFVPLNFCCKLKTAIKRTIKNMLERNTEEN